MTNIIQFPIRPGIPIDPGIQDDKVQQLRRIQRSLRAINKLLEEIKHDDRSRQANLNQRDPGQDYWD